MARFRVTAYASRVGAPGNPVQLRSSVTAACARDAACELAAAYVDAGLTVVWRARHVGPLGWTRRWAGTFTPGDDDGLAGVREPRRQPPSAGSAAAAL